MYEILLIIFTILILYTKSDENIKWFKDVKVIFFNEKVNDVMYMLNKKFKKPFNYSKLYPKSDKGNCWFLEYDNLDLEINNRNFVKLLHTVILLSKESDILLLKITSPGGLLTDYAEIYSLIKNLKAKKKMKVIISINKMCASGGYLLATLGDEIYCTELAMIGSIGIMNESFNISELLEKIGINYISIKSGEMKNPMCPFVKPSNDQLSQVKSQVDYHMDTFISFVSSSRGDKIKDYSIIKSGTTFNGLNH